MIPRLLLAAALLLGTAPAFAQDAPTSPALTLALQDCIEAVHGGAAPDADDRSDETPALDACIGVGTNACQDETGGSSTQGIAACNSEEQRFWDDLLNQMYGQLADVLEPNVYAALRKAQKAWIPWRDARCAFVDANAGAATIRSVVFTYCLLDTTAQRAIELMQLIDTGDGGTVG